MTTGEDKIVDRIGLLFVHGIGEQKRFEHLKNSAQEFAELLKQAHHNAIVTVVDRTETWTLPAGTPAPDEIAPLTISVRSDEMGQRQIHFECHEVWWADLGTRSGLGDVITFWLWGLGQWGAPMYREIDASGLPKDATAQRRDDLTQRKPVSSLTRLPKQLAGMVRAESWTRFRLGLAGLAAALVAASWLLAKRAFQALLGQAPSPVLLVRYVGDVRTYESRWTPGDANLTDPGHPRRVAIRRRMVTEMVAMGARAQRGELNGWYVCAHSLGTVVAYNGLTEISHALPNYLSEQQWDALPPELKRDEDCKKRDAHDLHNMMPSRPDWLNYEDVVNRPLLFRALRGLLTYGSPLDKFAALWPRIVATATDQPDGKRTFSANCDWLNLSAPHDPVAGTIDSYNSYQIKDTLDGTTPEVINIVTPVGWKFGLAHITYFYGAVAENGSKLTRQKRAIMKWLLQQADEPLAKELTPETGDLTKRQPDWERVPLLVAGYAIILTLLSVGTGALWWAVFRAGGSLLNDEKMRLPTGWELLTATTFALGVALSVVVFFGLLRWTLESDFSRREALREHAGAAKALADANRTAEDQLRETLWRWTARMYAAQTAAAIAFLAGLAILALVAMAPVLDARIVHLPDRLVHVGACIVAICTCLGGALWPMLMLLGLLLASLAQAMLNKIVPATTNESQRDAEPAPIAG